MAPRALDKKPKILYIEDNPENRMLVRAVLEAAAYTIVEAEDGLAGIEAAIREEPALILLDINLPGVDGYEIVAILKSFPNLASTPVIAVTAYAMQGDRQRTLVAGCDGYIQKPINVDAFPRQVAEFLGGKREKVEGREEGVYLRELNQRLVYRLLNQVEELKRLNQHFVRRASQLADLHHAVQDITSELDVAPMLERLLRGLAHAIGTTSLHVELTEPPAMQVVVRGEAADQPRSVLSGTGVEPADDWTEVEWTLPLTVRERQLGVMVARQILPPGAKADEEQLLKIVADQVAIAVENARLYEGVVRHAAEQESLVESGRLLTGTLQVSEVLHRLSELVRTRLGADVVRILIRESDVPGEFRLHAQAGSTRVAKEATRFADDDEGLVGWIMKHRATLALTDVLTRPKVKDVDWIKGEGFVSFLGIPLFLENELVGVLTVWHRESHTFTPEELALGEALATSATVAIRNARLYEETRERLRHTETLLAVSQDASSTLELTEVLRRCTRAMVLALGADTGGAWLQSPDHTRLLPIVGYHVPKEAFETFAKAELALSDPRVLEWRQLQGPLYATDSQHDARLDHPLARVLRHKSLLIQPMRWKGEGIGGFAVAWLKDQHHFTPDELRLAEGIALQASVASENSRLYAGLKHQMAELKRTQAQLIQSTKLAAIGELAANIAHEINNPLTSVLGFASYLAERIPPGGPMREELSLIQEEAGRARDIVRDLLHFSRQREFVPQVTDLNQVLEQTVAMVRRQGAFDAITLSEAYAEGLPPVEIDVPRIKQVILNLINNAVYVMKDGGSLTLRSSADGDMVQVEVADTGGGIAPEHLDRIFEPFFTTKPEVSGTGLGLSVSLGIVQSHGGTIEAKSELGKGSNFIVKLPAKPGATVAPEAEDE
jgi:signal transduction histidine kinase/DNA-binding response OmpR family regulator